MKGEAIMNYMSVRHVRIAVIGVLLSLASTHAGAVTNEWFPGGSGFTGWPTNWIAISNLNDPVDLSAANKRLDFVGDAANPGAYWSANSNYFFIRMRVAVSNVTSSTFRDVHWIYIDRVDFTNGTAGASMPDYAITWDSLNNNVTKHGLELQTGTNLSSKTSWNEVQLNDIDGTSSSKVAPPDFNRTGDGYIRTIDMRATTNFGNTTYIDFAVKWSFVRANTALNTNQEWRIQFGSSNNSDDHSAPTDDIAGGYALSSPEKSSWGGIPLSQPLSATLGFSVYASSTNVIATFASANEAGYGDIVVYVWQSNDWLEVGRMPAHNNELLSADTQSYSIPLNGLKAGCSYIFKVVDEAGVEHVVTETVLVRTVKMVGVQMSLDTLAMTFETAANRQYVIMVSSDLVTWTPETVRSPTYIGWSNPSAAPFTAGPGTSTQVLVSLNGRSRAFFKPELAD
jgi:hypothetical protein